MGYVEGGNLLSQVFHCWVLKGSKGSSIGCYRGRNSGSGRGGGRKSTAKPTSQGRNALILRKQILEFLSPFPCLCDIIRSDGQTSINISLVVCGKTREKSFEDFTLEKVIVCRNFRVMLLNGRDDLILIKMEGLVRVPLDGVNLGLKSLRLCGIRKLFNKLFLDIVPGSVIV